MRSTFSLGRIAGIRIGLNWSVLALLALLVWTLSTGVFPTTNPGIDDDDAYLAMAVCAAILFFVSILLHELGHAVQARRDGLQIDGITLWLFGGVARFRGGFPSAGAEFRIAVAGPLVSLAIGIISLGVAELGLPEPAEAVAAWLGFINLLLLAFNLLPALPLDGGRMLRAALWQRKGDLAAATAIAARAARVVSVLIIAAGAAMLVLLSGISGLWLIIIGWFLLQAAGAEGRAVEARSAVGDLRARDAMVRDPIATRPEATLSQFVEESVWGTRHAAYPVLEGGRPVGLMLVSRLAQVPEADWDRHRVAEVMVPLGQVPVVAPEDELIGTLEAIAQSVPGRALVLDDDQLVGLLSPADVRRALELRGYRVVSAPNGSRP